MCSWFAAVLVASEWWYGRSRWPFGVLLAYFLIMILTTARSVSPRAIEIEATIVRWRRQVGNDSS